MTTIQQIRSSSIWRILLFTSAVLALDGCITLREYAEQRRTPAPNYPPIYRFVDNPHLECLKAGVPLKPIGFTILACANWGGTIVPSKCLIILPRTNWEQYVEHELLHCEFGRYHD